MAEFILIGSNEKVQKIVTGISEYQSQSLCHHNISIGVVLHDEDGIPTKYNTVDRNTNTEENLSLDNYLLNQLAHHRANSTPQDAAVNIYMLCPLYDKQDITDIDFLYNGMRSLMDNDTNVNVTWVLFSFDLTNSPDVKKRASKNDIQKVLNQCKQLPIKDSTTTLPLFPSKVLYLNNRDMDNAAINFNETDQYNFVVDFLSGIFYLSSNPNDAYNMVNSCQSDIFSIGYADFAYRPQDVSQYMSLQLQFDRLQNMFNSNVDLSFEGKYDEADEVIDIIKVISTIFPDPVGLNKKKEFLSKIYQEPSFDIINDFKKLDEKLLEAWIFGAQEYYLQKLKPYVIKYNDFCQQKYQEALEEYKQLFDGINPDDIPDKEQFISSRNLPTSISYITWQDVINASPEGKMTKMEKIHLQELFNGYMQLKKEVLKDDFYEKLNYVPEDDRSTEYIEEIAGNSNHGPETKKGCWFKFLSFFRKGETDNGNVTPNQSNICQSSTNTTDDTDNIRDYWSMFSQLEESKEIYKQFNHLYQLIDVERQNVKSKIETFRLYQHQKSNSIIILDNLKNYFQSILSELLNSLDNYRDNNCLFITLTDVQSKSNMVVRDLEHKWNRLDWDNPFPFIENMSDLDNRIECLQQHSSIFADIIQDSTSNPLSRIFIKVFSNSQNQINKINVLKDNHKIHNAQYITATSSRHILNRLCMYKIINISTEEIKDLHF